MRRKNGVDTWTLKEQVISLGNDNIIVYKKEKDIQSIKTVLSRLTGSTIHELMDTFTQLIASFSIVRVGYTSSAVKWWIDSCQFGDKKFYLTGTLEVDLLVIQDQIEDVRRVLDKIAKDHTPSKIIAYLDWKAGKSVSSCILPFEPFSLRCTTQSQEKDIKPKEIAKISARKIKLPPAKVPREEAESRVNFLDPKNELGENREKVIGILTTFIEQQMKILNNSEDDEEKLKAMKNLTEDLKSQLGFLEEKLRIKIFGL